MNYETRQFLGETAYAVNAPLPPYAAIQPRMVDFTTLRGFIIGWYGYGRSPKEAVVGMVKSGNAPVNDLELMNTGAGPGPYSWHSSREYGFWGRKLWYVPFDVYSHAVDSASSIQSFIDYLKLYKCAGLSFNYLTEIQGVPLNYQGAKLVSGTYEVSAWAEYLKLVNRFSERVTAYFVDRLTSILSVTGWENLATASAFLNYEKNATDPQSLANQITSLFATTVTVQVIVDKIIYGGGWEQPVSHMASLSNADYPVKRSTLDLPYSSGKPPPATIIFVELGLPDEVKKMLWLIYKRAYQTLIEGPMLNLAAQEVALSDPETALALRTENLDPRKNPFLVYDAKATEAAGGKTTYRNIAKSVAISLTPKYVTPGVTVGAPDAPIATPNQYKTAEELLKERLRVSVDPYGLPVSPYDLKGTPPENPNLLPWLLAGVAAVAVVKGVTG